MTDDLVYDNHSSEGEQLVTVLAPSIENNKAAYNLSDEAIIVHRKGVHIFESVLEFEDKNPS